MHTEATEGYFINIKHTFNAYTQYFISCYINNLFGILSLTFAYIFTFLCITNVW